MSTTTITVTINGEVFEETVPVRMLLVDFIRERAALTGTHIGCTYEGVCGACTVQIDGDAVKSCTTLALQVEGADVTTIEGLATNGELHPMQEAFRDNHALQCGFCTPGMVMAAIDLVNKNPNPDEQTVRHELEGNLCRCTGYHNIVKAIIAGGQAMGG